MNLRIFELVKKERERQDELWGKQNHPDGLWLTILVEEVGEVARELQGRSPNPEAARIKRLREELVQVAAVAIAWAERRI